VKFLLDHDVPDDLSYLLEQLGHDVTLLRKALPGDSSDEAVLQFAYDCGSLLLTCNRDDFLALAATAPHHGIVIVIRRRTRAEERAALFRLLQHAGETGLRNNVNFAQSTGDCDSRIRDLPFAVLSAIAQRES
jgi:predicted nuclease of predicted toxin-antitoxin system